MGGRPCSRAAISKQNHRSKHTSWVPGTTAQPRDQAAQELSTRLSSAGLGERV